jgi:NADH dehydrogenase
MPKTYEIAGPKTMRLRELFELAGRCGGASRPIVHLPEAIARMQAWLMERMPGPTLMSRDNLDSMKAPNVASGTLPGLRELGIEATSIEAIAPLYLKPESRLDQFRKHASR